MDWQQYAINSRSSYFSRWLVRLAAKRTQYEHFSGIGTLTAYTASLVALLFPQMGWECFFDEPVMMLGFILLGRTLERQARG